MHLRSGGIEEASGLLEMVGIGGPSPTSRRFVPNLKDAKLPNHGVVGSFHSGDQDPAWSCRQR